MLKNCRNVSENTYIVKLSACVLVELSQELKHAKHKNSTETYVFDVLVKILLEMSCRLLVACDEMRKRQIIDKINVKTSKSGHRKSKL